MLQNLVNTVIRLSLAVLGLALIVALFFIGIIALWYFLLVGTALWILRSLYLAWQRRKQGPIQADGVEIIVHEERPVQRPPSGRIIDH
jgi:hypothetical protein